MSQVYTVEKAFQSTVSKEDKTPQVVQTKGGDMHKYMVQVEGQGTSDWLGILKKPGNVVTVGDEMYGDLVTNQWGKLQFNRAQMPQDGSVRLNTAAPAAPAARALQAPAAQPNGEQGDKLDYIISMLENFLESKGIAKPEAGADGPQSDDGPVDLSEIDY